MASIHLKRLLPIRQLRYRLVYLLFCQYQEAQQKKLQARLDYLEEQKEHYENEIKEVKEEMTSLSIEDKSK